MFIIWTVEYILVYIFFLNEKQEGETSVHIANKNNCHDCLALLLSHGADISAMNNVSDDNNMGWQLSLKRILSLWSLH